ncbi:MAG: 2-keto-4-pentenoate hydratase [Ktedonobacteraceae bacterium]
MNKSIQDYATLLHTAERRRVPIAPLSAEEPALTIVEAYAIQSAWFELRSATGERLVGRKIGLTSQAMQQQLGVDQPDYGFLLDTMVVPSRGALAFENFIQPRIEPEIAFWLAADLHGPGVTLEQVLQATRGVSAALEVVDSRIRNWRIALVDTIADNASSARVIVSEQLFPIEAFDLAKVHVTMTRDGEEVGSGTGAAVLGHPAAAVAWLANKLTEFGTSLEAGQLVLPGAMCAAVPIGQGDTFRAAFDRLGDIAISFT